jgi:heme-degrading monooxygenase HmoA
MICALTVRTLRPGPFDEFREAFMQPLSSGLPPGFQRFDMVRNSENPDEVICFGFYDGTPEQLRAAAPGFGYEQQQSAIEQYVVSVGTDGLFEVVEDITP